MILPTLPSLFWVRAAEAGEPNMRLLSMWLPESRKSAHTRRTNG